MRRLTALLLSTWLLPACGGPPRSTVTPTTMSAPEGVDVAPAPPPAEEPSTTDDFGSGGSAGADEPEAAPDLGREEISVEVDESDFPEGDDLD